MGNHSLKTRAWKPSVDNTGNHDGGSSGQGSGHVVGHVGHGNSHVVVGHDGGGQSSENQGYGPIRQTPLTQACVAAWTTWTLGARVSHRDRKMLMKRC